MISFADACSLVASLLDGPSRHELVARFAAARDLGSALRQLRGAMTSGVWTCAAGRVRLQRMLQAYDRKTRDDGFHALHDWDSVADTVNEQTIPVDVLDFLVDERGSDPVDRSALAILLDYYFLNVLALLSLRIWDSGNADGDLDRLNALLRELQGPNGSGQRFAADAETLLLIATSHYEMNERGFTSLLERVRTLNARHRTNIAVGHAASMGCHLRFGLEATYASDPIAMRNDNTADYPWLGFALATLMSEYAGLHANGTTSDERDALVEALLNGLSADARAYRQPSSVVAGVLRGGRQDYLTNFRRTDNTCSRNSNATVRRSRRIPRSHSS
jgi:hypothetical protein